MHEEQFDDIKEVIRSHKWKKMVVDGLWCLTPRPLKETN